MAEYTKVALDAMGGDYAPAEIIKGAVDAVNKRKDIRVVVVGKEDIIKAELAKYTYDKEQIEIRNASEVIETAEPPVMAIREKRDSSLVVGMNMVRQKEADALVSAGSSGAILVGGQVIVETAQGPEFATCTEGNHEVEDEGFALTFGSEEWLQMDAGLLTREEGDRIMREKGAALRRSFEVGVILDDWYDMLRTKDDTVQLIKRLKKRGYGVFYLSNISWDVLEMLQQRKFWQLFDGGVASCEVKLTKPDLRIYHALLAKYGLSAAESIFIDDNPANASAAFDADITGIHFKNVRTLQRALLSYGVESEKKLSRQKQAATVAAE